MLTYGSAAPEDIDSIFSFAAALIDQYEDFSCLDREKVLAWTRKSIEVHLPSCCRVYRDGNLAGYFCICSREGKTELDNLFILPAFREQGIGTRILKKVISEAENDVFLYVFRENRGAVSLYERMGFRITQEAGNTRYIMEYQKEGC